MMLRMRKVVTSSMSTITNKTFVHFQKIFNKSIKTQEKSRLSYILMCISVVASKVLTFKVCTLLKLGCYPNLIVLRI